MDLILNIRKGNIQDASSILELQRNNLYSLLEKEERQKNGFVRIELTLDEILDIIHDETIVVAEYEEKIIGYYLIASGCNNFNTFSYLKENCDSLVYKKKVIGQYKVGYGTQACVHKNYRGHNIGIKLFYQILEQLKNRFEILLGSITKDNLKGYILSTKNIAGLTIKEDNERSYILFDIENLLCNR